jgi:predicted ATPase
LYEGGLNLELFLPFIDLMEKYCIVHSLEESAIDYRLLVSSREEKTMYLVATTIADFTACRATINSRVQELRDGAESTSVELKVGTQRRLTVLDADSQNLVGRFCFEDLCGKDFGAQDFRAIARHFSIVVMEEIPVLTLEEHNKARRFITLVDELYEARVALLCSAAAPPSGLFACTVARPAINVSSDDIQSGIDQAVNNGHAVGALASVRELSFAFRRAASRLSEMTSGRWWHLVLQNGKVKDATMASYATK